MSKALFIERNICYASLVIRKSFSFASHLPLGAAPGAGLTGMGKIEKLSMFKERLYDEVSLLWG